MLCVLNFIHEWRDLQFKVDFERQTLENLFMAILIYPLEFLPEICWEEVAEEIFFIFSLMEDI